MASYKSDSEWDQSCVGHVLEKFQQETTAAFMQFCRKCDQSGFSIDGDAFIKLIMDRLGQTFDRFRTKFESDKNQEDSDKLTENYEKELAEFTEAAKKLIKDKEMPKEMQNKQRIVDLLQRCASDVFGKDGNGKKPIIDVNVTNIKNDNNHDESSLIVSVEMSSKDALCKKSGQTKRSKQSKRAAKKGAKKSQMTITAVLEQSPAGLSQQLTITKNKSGSLSISGVSIKTSDKNPLNKQENAKSTTNEIPTNNVPKTVIDESQPKESQEKSELVKYSCVHCHDVNHWIELFNAPKDVYSHWLSWHTEPVKTFQYYVIEYATCYHCKTTGTYYELIKHHKDCHHALPFVIVNQNDNKKCALCPYNGFGIIAHFHAAHKTVLKTLSLRQVRNFRTPHQLDSTVLEKHLGSKVHKKQKCGNCNIVFETERDLRNHHNKCHKTSKMTVKEFYDNHCIHLICSCRAKVDRNLYLGHIENHMFNFKCHRCDFTTMDMIELVKHDKTHGLGDSFEYRCIQFKNRLKRDYLKTFVIFGNGMMTTKQNLLKTKYDDEVQFDAFVDTLVKIKKERHSQQELK